MQQKHHFAKYGHFWPCWALKVGQEYEVNNYQYFHKVATMKKLTFTQFECLPRLYLNKLVDLVVNEQFWPFFPKMTH